MSPAPDKSWNARLTEQLLRPWCDSGLIPNHLTTLRLLGGLVACARLSPGEFWPASTGAPLSSARVLHDYPALQRRLN